MESSRNRSCATRAFPVPIPPCGPRRSRLQTTLPRSDPAWTPAIPASDPIACLPSVSPSGLALGGLLWRPRSGPTKSGGSGCHSANNERDGHAAWPKGSSRSPLRRRPDVHPPLSHIVGKSLPFQIPECRRRTLAPILHRLAKISKKSRRHGSWVSFPASFPWSTLRRSRCRPPLCLGTIRMSMRRQAVDPRFQQKGRGPDRLNPNLDCESAASFGKSSNLISPLLTRCAFHHRPPPSSYQLKSDKGTALPLGTARASRPLPCQPNFDLTHCPPTRVAGHPGIRLRSRATVDRR